MEPKAYQGFAINMRREKFQDVRVRRALCFLINRNSWTKSSCSTSTFCLIPIFPIYIQIISIPTFLWPISTPTARGPFKSSGVGSRQRRFFGKNGRLSKFLSWPITLTSGILIFTLKTSRKWALSRLSSNCPSQPSPSEWTTTISIYIGSTGAHPVCEIPRPSGIPAPPTK